MIFWVDTPLTQWIYKKKEELHLHPWCVIIGDCVRARCTTEREADDIIAIVLTAFPSAGVTDTELGTTWVYCSQHRRVHPTGWCTVPNRDKTALSGKSYEEAHAEAIHLNLMPPGVVK